MPTNPLTRIPMRAARWSATHPWRALAAWLAFVAVAVVLAMAVPTAETTDADYQQGESGRAEAMMTDAGLVDVDSENVLITSQDANQPDRAEAAQAAQDLTALMGDTEGVAAVSEPQWSPDGSALLIAIQLAKDQDDVADLITNTKEIQADYPTLEVRQVGDVSLDEAIDERVGEDLASAEGISVPVTLILMLLAFGALIAAGLPVLLAVSSVAATIGVLAPLSHLVHAEFDGHQHDRPDRHGRRRRLLAVLPQARA